MEGKGGVLAKESHTNVITTPTPAKREPRAKAVAVYEHLEVRARASQHRDVVVQHHDKEGEQEGEEGNLQGSLSAMNCSFFRLILSNPMRKRPILGRLILARGSRRWNQHGPKALEKRAEDHAHLIPSSQNCAMMAPRTRSQLCRAGLSVGKYPSIYILQALCA